MREEERDWKDKAVAWTVSTVLQKEHQVRRANSNTESTAQDFTGRAAEGHREWNSQPWLMLNKFNFLNRKRWDLESQDGDIWSMHSEILTLQAFLDHLLFKVSTFPYSKALMNPSLRPTLIPFWNQVGS